MQETQKLSSELGWLDNNYYRLERKTCCYDNRNNTNNNKQNRSKIKIETKKKEKIYPLPFKIWRKTSWYARGSSNMQSAWVHSSLASTLLETEHESIVQFKMHYLNLELPIFTFNLLNFLFVAKFIIHISKSQ